MAEVISILMVEDNKEQQQAVQDAIDEYNEGNGDLPISIETCVTAQAAISKLCSNKNYDAVFIDLKLKGDTEQGGIASGNEVIDHITDAGTGRYLIYVISGTLESLEETYRETFNNPLLRAFERTTETKVIIDDLISSYKTGVTKILGRRGKLEQFINKIYLEHLSTGFDYWRKGDEDKEIELLRYTTLHLLEYLDCPSVTPKEDDPQHNEVYYFEPEFYVLPPIKKHFSTGDIIEYNSKRYVLISPACDIALRGYDGETPKINVESIVLLEILPFDKKVIVGLGVQLKNDGCTNSDAWRRFTSSIKENKKNRFSYIPEYSEIKEGFIDFKRIINIPVSDYLSSEKTTRIATITSPFISDIQAQFSNYYARQGQPSGLWAKK